jgi:hypothetical protein
MFTTFFADIADNRRPQGRRYELDKILLLSVIAILCNAKSYRDISRFIKVRFDDIKREFGLKWHSPPAYTTVRNIIQSVCQQELEAAFRAFTQSLTHYRSDAGKPYHIGIDGKVLRQSFDRFEDKKAAQILSFFDGEQYLILGHVLIDDKSNEIPAFQLLLQNLEIPCALFSADAIHCQKKLLRKPMLRVMPYSYSSKTTKARCSKMCNVYPKRKRHAMFMSRKPS